MVKIHPLIYNLKDCDFLSHKSDFYILEFLFFSLRIVRYKLAIIASYKVGILSFFYIYKVQFGGGRKTDMFSEFDFVSQL